MPVENRQRAQKFAPANFTAKASAKEMAAKKQQIPEIQTTTTVDLDALKKALPTEVQIKYASLLNMLPGMLTNVKLLETIDDWYGTRYRYGGTSKAGIDCSAFVRAVYKVAFDIDLPRTAREQFRAASYAVASDLKQGDLLFFNTTGGISHVGMYLGNNKFVHASSGRGVTVSGLDENYYAARYLGARRMTDSSYFVSNN
ncbi:C40 family peptidase [Niabella insulamsoli]|uniref:C40 family peptidase n=1 Tax=Niabella insulamsoli TaxID=3144874 RepID=UPI0031FE0DE4